ncbi:hypothetical protein PPL_07247 [Heterostelium album PN500]|uniref:Uncharacterized protein n=1 Tax=Heterostelium pallidum (strain ATCC 26659 / Pp 5 / PN500) TaxID=670386 RepID=D3BET2_HETP5|nr:hypothetical protein PPL_07247 [Heterostelium album PN500]EFA80413.1 hypothetical protein PPL_07247 [Heterostelium album PN500]|eukprot:XP_020432533.1 hypothetical protein PPL_07247 [Heterostelium album PN500]
MSKNNEFVAMQEQVIAKPPRTLNYEFLQPLAAAPVIGLIKFVGSKKYPRLNWVLYGTTVGCAFLHGAYLLNKSYGNIESSNFGNK